MIQHGGIFIHLVNPKVCSHIREVEFDSQHAPSNTTFGRWIVGLVIGIWIGFGSWLRLWMANSLLYLFCSVRLCVGWWLLTPPQAQLVDGRES